MDAHELLANIRRVCQRQRHQIVVAIAVHVAKCELEDLLADIRDAGQACEAAIAVAVAQVAGGGHDVRQAIAIDVACDDGAGGAG